MMPAGLVGRDAELAVVRRLVGAAADRGRRRGAGRVGEAGVGKSRLLAEAAALARAAGWPCSPAGRCEGGGTYRALAEALLGRGPGPAGADRRAGPPAVPGGARPAAAGLDGRGRGPRRSSVRRTRCVVLGEGCCGCSATWPARLPARARRPALGGPGHPRAGGLPGRGRPTAGRCWSAVGGPGRQPGLCRGPAPDSRRWAGRPASPAYHPAAGPARRRGRRRARRAATRRAARSPAPRWRQLVDARRRACRCWSRSCSPGSASRRRRAAGPADAGRPGRRPARRAGRGRAPGACGPRRCSAPTPTGTLLADVTGAAGTGRRWTRWARPRTWPAC